MRFVGSIARFVEMHVTHCKWLIFYQQRFLKYSLECTAESALDYSFLGSRVM